ncbi:MAG: peptide deformylase [Patescibacteria group bacterium]|jgi:peptide deformylase
MKIKIVKAGDPCLRRKSKPVSKIDKKILTLIADMKETLLAEKDPEGVGLAAPQVGKNIRLFIMRINGDIKTVINPKIISVSKIKTTREDDKKKKALEGCLSIPYYYGAVARTKEIKISYTTEEGKRVAETFKGFPARIVEHEIDHLNGVLFIDHLLEQKLPLYEIKDDIAEEVDFV